ncbi:dUTP diphosphatase [bacterium]|nr:dUTP diphosphatase [bacterium]
MISKTETAEVETVAAKKTANKIAVKFKLTGGTALPEYKTEGAAGADICSNEDCIINPNSWKLVSTGIFPEIPENFEIQVRSRSGLAAKNGIFVLNSPGTVDSDYRGEIKVILANMSDKVFKVKKGDRIAQLVVAPVCQADFETVSEISATERSSGGFGSTGME